MVASAGVAAEAVEDPRVERSRRALLAAAIELLRERDVADISVTDLVAAAGMSRPTFYQHFDTVAGVVAAAAAARLGDVVRASDVQTVGLPDAAFVRATVEVLVAELYEHRVVYQRALSGAPGFATMTSVVELLRTRMRARWTDAADEDRITATAAGVTWIGATWLDSDFRGEDAPSAMADRLTRLLVDAGGAR